jgi:hypothetical protein
LGLTKQWISAGLLTFVAGTAIPLVRFALTAGGVVTVVGGTGVATKATVEEILRKRIEKKIREKGSSWNFVVTELGEYFDRITGWTGLSPVHHQRNCF